ncbi:hypothetical protein [Klebsiella quasipneumoniae]|uniref:hypothetical protein n=1 Tax=Klebsiella quasipneumoniae TaxID=1463165 RepID=UPI003F1D2D85
MIQFTVFGINHLYVKGHSLNFIQQYPVIDVTFLLVFISGIDHHHPQEYDLMMPPSFWRIEITNTAFHPHPLTTFILFTPSHNGQTIFDLFFVIMKQLKNFKLINHQL